MFLKYLFSLFTKITLSVISCTSFYCGLQANNEVAEPSQKVISKIIHIDSIDVIQVHLTNGMTFCLKKTDFETDEVFFKLAAVGGFASLDSNNYFSGQLADKIAWESGMGGMTSDQITVFLYENSLEFLPEISAFCRTIEGQGQEDSIEAFFQCVKMLFTQQQFTEEGLKIAKNLSKEIINKLNNDNERVYEAEFLRVNTQNFPALRSMTVNDLQKVNFQESKNFFYKSFSDPSEFFCVITGPFDVDKVIKLIERYMGGIQKPKNGFKLKKTFSVPFPSGITESIIKLRNQSSCLTHVTFPVKINVNEQNIYELAFLCQIMEARLRHVIIDKMDLSYGVDVSYEFPLYPLLDNPWVSIRYRCENKFIGSLKEIVITELKHLQSQGVTDDEIEKIKKLEKGSQEFWLKDDFYWVSMLSNYYLWGWNPEKIDYKNTSIQSLNVQTVNAILKNAISLNNYSVVTAIPEKDK